MRPWLSVAGTRCTRCTPDSNFSRRTRLRPVISAMPSFRPPSSVSPYSSTSKRQPCRPAYFWYMANSSAANSPASSPPAAGRISRIAERVIRLVLRQQREADRRLQLREALLQLCQFGLGQLLHFRIGEHRLGLRGVALGRRAARRCARPIGSSSDKFLRGFHEGVAGQRARRAARAAPRRGRRCGRVSASSWSLIRSCEGCGKLREGRPRTACRWQNPSPGRRRVRAPPRRRSRRRGRRGLLARSMRRLRLPR